MTNRRLQLRLSQQRGLLMAGDVLAVLLSVFIALALQALSSRLDFTAQYVVDQRFWFLFFACLWLVLANANDLYRQRIDWRVTRMVLRLVRVTLQMLLLYAVIYFLAERNELPRLFMLYFGAVSVLLVGAWRLFWPALRGWASEPRRVLIVGEGQGVTLIREAIEEQAADAYKVVAVLAPADLPAGDDGPDLTSMARAQRVSEIIVTATQGLDIATLQGVMDATVAGISVLPMPVLYERITGRVPVSLVEENWSVVLPLDDQGVRPWDVLKSTLDYLLAIAGMIALALLFPFIALAIRLDSRGAVLYSQQRVGRNGRNFRMVKFRSMRADAEAETGAVFAEEDDPRITRVGRYLRRSHLDELPQVINILRGEMSLVGPRPERPEHVAKLTKELPFYRIRQMLLPGVTGWAQVHQDYASGVADTQVKLQYDLYYVRNHSFLLDLEILLRTTGRVLDTRGYRKQAQMVPAQRAATVAAGEAGAGECQISS